MRALFTRKEKLPAAAAVRPCGHCAHFTNDPATLAELFPGLTALSSAHGSTKAHDGLCRLHDRYLSWRDTCPSFTPPGADRSDGF